MTLKNLKPHNSYNAGLRGALHKIMDMLAAATTASVLMVLVRVDQFGESFLLLAALLISTCLVPFFILREDRHIKLRAAIMIAGHLLGTGFVIFTLGIATSSLVVLPFCLALSATVFDSQTTKYTLAATGLSLLAFAVLFTVGWLEAPDITLHSWNTSVGNWAVTLFITLMFSQLGIWLIESMKRSWRHTDSDSSETFSQFETLFEYAPEAIGIVDVSLSRFVAANAKAETLFGLPRDELIKRDLFTLLSPEYQPTGDLSQKQAHVLLRRVLKGERPTFNWIHLNADGIEIPCEISLSRIPPFDKQLVRASIVDMSDRLAERAQREALQSQLAASQRMEAIGQLTGGVAHDFNNLLAVVLGNLELLSERTKDPDHLRLLKPSIAATQRGADLTNNMLSYARRAFLSPTVVNLNELVRETHTWMGRTLPSNITVKTRFAADLWAAKVDRAAVESALLNLIINARDEMHQGGTLTLTTRNQTLQTLSADTSGHEVPPGRYVVVTISDSGAGIAPEMLPKVFEPFFTTKTADTGSGLGLPMVLGLMQQSGGTVLAHSTPGQGTTFELFFPATDETESLDHDPSLHAGITETPPCRILLVEDQQAVRNVMQEILENAGHLVRTAPTADAAKALFDAAPDIDLLVTDIVMPGKLQGNTLAQVLRQSTPDLPAIFVSGYTPEALNPAPMSKADIRLTKPVQRADLLRAVATAMSQKNARS